jgi:hypothetical protein
LCSRRSLPEEEAINTQRTQAYRRVLGTLSQMGPSKLWPDEQERIRNAADTLIFSSTLVADIEAQAALEDAGRLCQNLVASGRWEADTASRLAEDVSDCGPEPETELSPA